MMKDFIIIINVQPGYLVSRIKFLKDKREKRVAMHAIETTRTSLSSASSGSLELTSSSDAGPSLFPSLKRNSGRDFHGVAFDSGNSEKWSAFIDVPDQGYFKIGLFDSAEAAARAYDEVACRIQGAELNFERGLNGGKGDSAEPEEAKGFVRSSGGQLKRTSKYAGVSFNKNNGKWEIAVKVPGEKAIRLSFDNEVEAALKYDSLVSHNSFWNVITHFTLEISIKLHSGAPAWAHKKATQLPN